MKCKEVALEAPDLTKVWLIGAAFQTNTFLGALNQEVSYQLVGQVA